jgi:mono/diheme cytochrome c family protein
MLMKQLHIGSLQRALLLGVLTIGLVVGGYFTFRRTLLASVQEAVINPDVSDPIAYGATLFQTRGCAGCHTLASAGAVGDEGPDLSDIGARHDADYIYQSIQSPQAVIAEGCPETPCQPIMPDYGAILTPDQINALVAYLSTQQ